MKKKILLASAVALSSVMLLAAKPVNSNNFIFQNTPVMQLIAHSNLSQAQKTQLYSQMYADQLMFADLWMQNSGEYRALCYQAFNTAEQSFMTYKKAHPNEKLAVIVDLDETMLDNEAQTGYQLKNSVTFNQKVWSKWVQSEQVKPTPGSVAFSHFIENNGGTIFYISDRSQANKASTIASLNKLGFANVSQSSVMLKTTTSDKVARFDKVKQMGYTIVLQMGDNLSDLTGDTFHKSNAQRRAWVDSNKTQFGVKYFVIPNPIYGGWVSGLSKDYYSNSVQQQLQIDANNVQAWNGQ
ncbi:MAG: 5'-nucleotidase, lipoprotein e(P4) family [Psittacicella sp.]